MPDQCRPHRIALQGQASDIAIHAKEILKMRDLLNNIYARHTGQQPSKIGEPQHAQRRARHVRWHNHKELDV